MSLAMFLMTVNRAVIRYKKAEVITIKHMLDMVSIVVVFTILSPLTLPIVLWDRTAYIRTVVKTYIVDKLNYKIKGN